MRNNLFNNLFYGKTIKEMGSLRANLAKIQRSMSKLESRHAKLKNQFQDAVEDYTANKNWEMLAKLEQWSILANNNQFVLLVMNGQDDYVIEHSAWYAFAECNKWDILAEHKMWDVFRRSGAFEQLAELGLFEEILKDLWEHEHSKKAIETLIKHKQWQLMAENGTLFEHLSQAIKDGHDVKFLLDISRRNSHDWSKEIILYKNEEGYFFEIKDVKSSGIITTTVQKTTDVVPPEDLWSSHSVSVYFTATVFADKRFKGDRYRVECNSKGIVSTTKNGNFVYNEVKLSDYENKKDFLSACWDCFVSPYQSKYFEEISEKKSYDCVDVTRSSDLDRSQFAAYFDETTYHLRLGYSDSTGFVIKVFVEREPARGSKSQNRYDYSINIQPLNYDNEDEFIKAAFRKGCRCGDISRAFNTRNQYFRTIV